MVYANANYNKYNGMLYGEYIDASATTYLGNLNNQFKFGKGWSGEISGWYRSKGLEGQIIIEPMGAASAAISKQLFKEKANVKLGLRDIFYTQQAKGHINFNRQKRHFIIQETVAS